jgi:hypothetical protein
MVPPTLGTTSNVSTVGNDVKAQTIRYFRNVMVRSIYSSRAISSNPQLVLSSIFARSLAIDLADTGVGTPPYFASNLAATPLSTSPCLIRTSCLG